MPAIAKRKWHGQYVFLELFSIRGRDAKISARAGQGPGEAGVNEWPANLHLTHVRAPQLQRLVSSRLTCRMAPSAAAVCGRNRTSGLQQGCWGSNNTATGLIPVHKGAALRVRFPEAC